MDDSIIVKLDTFFSQFPSQSFKKGGVLIQAHTQPPGIFYIESGIVKEYRITQEGTEITLNLYKPHAFLPMQWAIGNMPNFHFYEAFTPIVVRKAAKDDFLPFLRDNHDIVYDLLRRMYVGIEGLWMHIESLTAGNSLIKLAASVVILAKRFGKNVNGKIVIDLQLNEQDLANLAGISRETASREISRLKKDAIITFSNKGITVNNMQKLEALLLK